ncbi:MAG TPA: enoyl-CoA hydratase-related protein [Chloroflexota bacterium]|nr:enoyl-CoA hydratase-related protein [Chloroflexota bacterium]
MYIHHEIAQERATIRIDRPEKRNALDGAGWFALRQILETLATPSAVRVLTVCSSGDTFCGGADVDWLARAPESELRVIGEVIGQLRALPMPVVCRVQGPTFGGGIGLVAAADFAIASTSATFTFSEARIGLAPVLISPVVIARVGAQRFRTWAMLAQPISAAEALSAGLVDVVTAPEELAGTVATIQEELVGKAPRSLVAIKQIPDAGSPPEAAARVLAGLRSAPDYAEGVQALRERRAPRWSTAGSG